MRIQSIKAHLKPYDIVRRRRTTINHAFAAAIAPFDSFAVSDASKRMENLGVVSSAGDLLCAYCNAYAETWDHVHATVEDGEFSGFGHQIQNLLPCCKPCNSRKGNRDWKQFFDALGDSGEWRTGRRVAIESHVSGARCDVDRLKADPQYKQYEQLRELVIKQLKEADSMACELRNRHFPND